ncbi:MAG: HEPN domain-containing protein [Deltaproteobacteria bacterium]|nr:HEPN domain-containing protein [Nannocystaceae bacterium]
MTEDNREANAKDELARGAQALDAAAALIAAGFHADAVSRAYYGAYHHLRALLYSRGLEPRSHAGALHLLNVEFIRPGVFPSANNRLLSGLQRSRELADYDPAAVFSVEDAKGALDDARAFATEVLRVLAERRGEPAGT